MPIIEFILLDVLNVADDQARARPHGGGDDGYGRGQQQMPLTGIFMYL